jgi:hypothetical protein
MPELERRLPAAIAMNPEAGDRSPSLRRRKIVIRLAAT